MQRTVRPVSRWKAFRYRLEVALVLTISCIVRCLTRRAVRRLGGWVGAIAYRLSGHARRIALANLDIAFGDTKTLAEKQRIARKSFQNMATTVLGLFWVPRLTEHNFQRYAAIESASLERIHRVLARGKGVVFITLHYGDWELMGQIAAYLGFPLVIVAEEMRNVALRKIFDQLREHSGNTLIPQRLATIKLLKALKRGQSIAMLTDLNGIPGYGGVWLDFFGLPVYNNATAAILALRTGAAILGGVGYPLPDGRCRIECSEEIVFTPTGNDAADIEALTKLCSDYCQKVIREHPEFWLWTYRRWKLRPTEEQGRYPFYSRHIPPR